MAYLEPLAFCSIEEYRRHESDRLSIDDVEVGELYTLMAKLESAERQAARNTVRILGITATDRLVTVMFHDDKLNETLEKEAHYTEDSYINTVDRLEIYDPRHKQCVLMGDMYLRDYFQDIYDQMLQESRSLQLTGV